MNDESNDWHWHITVERRNLPVICVSAEAGPLPLDYDSSTGMLMVEHESGELLVPLQLVDAIRANKVRPEDVA